MSMVSCKVPWWLSKEDVQWVGFKTVLVNDHFVKQFSMLYEIVQWEGPNLTNLYIEFDWL